MLRRARIKVDYILPAKEKNYPQALFTFQFDITERGAFARDIFLRLYEPGSRKLALTMGCRRARAIIMEVMCSFHGRGSGAGPGCVQNTGGVHNREQLQQPLTQVPYRFHLLM
jgi:hypothetical protein